MKKLDNKEGRKQGKKREEDSLSFCAVISLETRHKKEIIRIKDETIEAIPSVLSSFPSLPPFLAVPWSSPCVLDVCDL